MTADERTGAGEARRGRGYEELLQRVKEELAEAQEVTTEEVLNAVESARTFLGQARDASAEELARVAEMVRRDWRVVLEDVRDRAAEVKASPTFQALKGKGSELLLGLARRVKDVSTAVERALERERQAPGDPGAQP